MKTKLKSNFYFSLAVAALLGATACSSPEVPAEETAVAAVDTANVEVEVKAPIVTEEPDLAFEATTMTDNDRIIIYEDGMTHQPAPAEGEEKSIEDRHADSQFLRLYDERFLPQAGDLNGFMVSRDFTEIEVVETSTIVIPVEETQTLTAFNKKNKFEGEIQVVSLSSTGEIDHIAFTGKHHVDKYNVAAGLTGHEARKLRRDLKHMAHNGHVFLYTENSNILYLMDSKNLATGEDITEAEVDNMVVSAVLWKDASHMNDHDHDHAEGDGHDH